MRRTRLATAALAAVATLAAGACGDDDHVTDPARGAADAILAAAPAAARSELAAVRAATARYHDVARAVADGYASTVECVAIPGAGMGVHYVNGALVADPALDPLRPEVLVYEPQAGGQMQLVAVEYMIPKAMWDARSPDARPTLFGATFEDGPMATYALHAWVWEGNARGVFAPFNPSVRCPAGAGAAAGHAGH